MADPNHYDASGNVNPSAGVAQTQASVSRNEPSSSHNPAPKTGSENTPRFADVGRC